MSFKAGKGGGKGVIKGLPAPATTIPALLRRAASSETLGVSPSGSASNAGTPEKGGAGAADAQGGGCPALAVNEWLALAGSFSYDAKTRRATFHSSTRIKKSTINSSLQPPSDVLAVESGQVVRLGGGGGSAEAVVRRTSCRPTALS